MSTPFDPRRLLARPFAPIEHAYAPRDTQLYALGLGLGTDPLDEGQLRYVYEGQDGASLRALPTFANVLAYPGFWARESARRPRRRARFTAPAMPGDTLRTEMWVDGNTVSLRTTALERGAVVLNHSRVDLR